MVIFFLVQMGFHTTELHKTGSETNWFHFDSLMSKLDFVKPWKLLAQTSSKPGGLVTSLWKRNCWKHQNDLWKYPKRQFVAHLIGWRKNYIFCLALVQRKPSLFSSHCVLLTQTPCLKKKKKKTPAVPNCDLKKKRKEKKFFVFVLFLLSSLPKSPLLVVKLFDVKDDCFLFSVFSRDFTKAFGFTLVLSFLSRQKKKEGKMGPRKRNWTMAKALSVLLEFV